MLFVQQGDLRKHLRVHSVQKPYFCSQCTESFARASSLERHIRVHAGEKPYSCSLYSKSYKAVLRIRIRIHMFLGLPDPDPLVRGMDPDLDPSIIMQK
jgi:KRAB domain-containing zinc finger protein